MGTESRRQASALTRRSFLAGAGVGLAAGLPLGWLGYKGRQAFPGTDAEAPSFTGRTVEDPDPKYAMPGRFPGRVIEVHHPGAVRQGSWVQPRTVKAMMACGMCELTGADHEAEAWRSFFKPGEVVGIKVNPVGYKQRDGVIGAISSPAILLEVVERLRNDAGINPKNIIVFERYAVEFRGAGYDALMNERIMQGVRWYASSLNGGELQVDIEGYDGVRERDPHVVGYDPDVYVTMGFANPSHDPKDDRRFRSHLSAIVTKMIDKLITIPVLKDHRSAGVTLALKNLSHGLNNNVARSHLSGIARSDGAISGPNQCNTFIPTAVSHLATRQKATLHILDGLIGVYEGGPGNWNTTWATWPYQSVFFATDPVAMDHVGWEIIDAKRVQEGLPAVAQMGLIQNTPAAQLSRRLAALAAQGPAEAATLACSGAFFEGGRGTEVFDRRTPEHIILASLIGLGTFDAREIEHRRINLRA